MILHTDYRTGVAHAPNAGMTGPRANFIGEHANFNGAMASVPAYFLSTTARTPSPGFSRKKYRNSTE
ncbi:MAG TPA: hypothetical protein VG537_09430 [Candidatus Kapabacteria bacterium]|nr:hypothetical protein [Candidatus Kapabacteria bacterium]